MVSVEESESAVARLSREELSASRSWFVDFDAEGWHLQFENDVSAGRFDAMANEALNDLDQGRCTDL